MEPNSRLATSFPTTSLSLSHHKRTALISMMLAPPGYSLRIAGPRALGASAETMEVGICQGCLRSLSWAVRTPVARHTTCCLARRRLQYRVLTESVVFSSLVPSHSQLREALATTATPGSRSFCGHFPHRACPTLGWEELFGPEVRGSCRLYCMTAAGSFWSAILRL
jgi:hypothetical protein